MISLIIRRFRKLFLFAPLVLLIITSCVSSSKQSAPGSPVLPMCGADISFLPELEDAEAAFYSEDTELPLLDILKNNGVNWIRLRLWVDPSEHAGRCNLTSTVALAKRVKAAGFSFLLDIHYSDWWADPEHQTKPASWAALSFEDLVSRVGVYSRESVAAFVDAGAAPDMVQVGNEITGGMLWPDGKVGLASSFSAPVLYGTWDSNWKTAIPMTLVDENLWQATIPANSSATEFKVVGNGTWYGDSNADMTLDTADGAAANIILGSSAADRVLLVNDATLAYSFTSTVNPAPWDKLAALLSAGITGVKTAAPDTKIMLHIDKGGDAAACTSWYDKAKSYGLAYDIIGLSYYCFWQGTDLTKVSANLNNLASRYGKEVCIVETSYPWTLGWSDNTDNVVGLESQLIAGYPATPAGQKAYLSKLVQIVGDVPDSLGAGVFWWEPDFISADGFSSNQENLTWFDFDLNYNGTSRAFLGE